jgi:UDP:flavonoid glycosyltransferase YjiC (YdhE family)
MKMNPADLEDAVRIALTNEVRDRARDIGRKLLAEDGNARATEALSAMLTRAA